MVLCFESATFFTEVSPWQFVTDKEWTPQYTSHHYGIRPLLLGTCLTAGIGVLVAVPFGAFGALYLSEYANDDQRLTLSRALHLVAAIPGIVFAFIALVFVGPTLQNAWSTIGLHSALTAGVTLGLMGSPTLTLFWYQALSQIPQTDREAAVALGASSSTILQQIVLPQAKNRLFAGLLMAASKTVGETMIVAVVAGQKTGIALDPRQSTDTLTSFIARGSHGDIGASSIEHHALFAAGATLFCITLLFHWMSQRLLTKAPVE